MARSRFNLSYNLDGASFKTTRTISLTTLRKLIKGLRKKGATNIRVTKVRA